MKEDLLRHLADAGVERVVLNRDATIHGSPALGVEVYFRRGGKLYCGGFEFATANKMTAKHMAAVIVSHIGTDMERVKEVTA